MSHQFARGRLLGDWQRNHPEANRIARHLRSNPGMFGLETHRIVKDIRARYGVCDATAFHAIRIATEETTP